MPDLTDPTRSTSDDLSRRVFIGLSASAAALGASLTEVLAAGEGLGKAHEPLVPENDPGISVERPELARPDGAIDAYAAYPRNATARTPGVVVVHHIWGVDTQIRDVVRRFAKEGYVAIAPNLFSRLPAPSGDSATDYTPFAAVAAKLADDQVDGDVTAGATWIRARVKAGPTQRPPKVGVTGFCMGGSITLRQAVDSPAFDAAAVWYGKVRYGSNNSGAATGMSLAYADEIRMPLLGSFGARDTGILADDVRALQKRLKVANDIKIYDEAGHAFFDDQRGSYVASAAADAWSRTLAWFAKYLKS